MRAIPHEVHEKFKWAGIMPAKYWPLSEKSASIGFNVDHFLALEANLHV